MRPQHILMTSHLSDIPQMPHSVQHFNQDFHLDNFFPFETIVSLTPLSVTFHSCNPPTHHTRDKSPRVSTVTNKKSLVTQPIRSGTSGIHDLCPTNLHLTHLTLRGNSNQPKPSSIRQQASHLCPNKTLQAHHEVSRHSHHTSIDFNLDDSTIIPVHIPPLPPSFALTFSV